MVLVTKNKKKLICWTKILIICSNNQCCRSGMFILDPTFFDPRSRIRSFFHSGSASKNLSILTPKNWFLSSWKYDPGCSSLIQDPDPDFLPIPDPRSRGLKGTGSRIRIRNTANNAAHLFFVKEFQGHGDDPNSPNNGPIQKNFTKP